MREYLPGESIVAEIEFIHNQVIREVFVVYEHTEGTGLPLVLSGAPEVIREHEGSHRWTSEATVVRVVGVDHAPGIYQLTAISLETFGRGEGRRINLVIDDKERSRHQAELREFKIVEEPDTTPAVKRFEIT